MNTIFDKSPGFYFKFLLLFCFITFGLMALNFGGLVSSIDITTAISIPFTLLGILCFFLFIGKSMLSTQKRDLNFFTMVVMSIFCLLWLLANVFTIYDTFF